MTASELLELIQIVQKKIHGSVCEIRADTTWQDVYIINVFAIYRNQKCYAALQLKSGEIDQMPPSQREDIARELAFSIAAVATELDRKAASAANPASS
jgi:hypothetical protein